MNKNRISLLDEIRGLSIIAVVIYHFFYTASQVFRLTWAIDIFSIMRVIQPVLPITFIIISGISFNLSNSNEKRGFRLMGVAILITLVTAIFIPSQVIWFGIIHFLAVSNLACSQYKKALDKIPFILGIILSAILFIATFNVKKGYLGFPPFSVNIPEIFYKTDIVMMLGTHSKSFYTADYTPLLPWIFLFIGSIFAGRYINKLPDFFKKTHIKPLAFVGRHTLITYIVHQPVIFGLLYVLTELF